MVSLSLLGAVTLLLPHQNPHNQNLVPLTTHSATIRAALAYATPNNCTGTALYHKNAKAYGRPELKAALQTAAKILKAQGYGILILDAYRPYNITCKLWLDAKAKGKDLRYFAGPTLGSDHNRGTAVDITLYYLQTQKPVAMPCEYDNCTYVFHPKQITSPEEKNALILRDAMLQAGFLPHSREWWHFSIPSLKNLPLLNFPL
jgi:D-alanyl-D-alanine dipeptidase